MKFCPNCGTELKEGARFCPNCGYDLEALEAEASSSQNTGRDFGQRMKDQFVKMTTDENATLELEPAVGMDYTRRKLKFAAQKSLSGRYGEWFKTILIYLIANVLAFWLMSSALGRIFMQSAQRMYYSYGYGYGLYDNYRGPSAFSTFFWVIILLVAIVFLFLLNVLLQAVYQWAAIHTLRGYRADGVKIFRFFIVNEKKRVLWANILVGVFTSLWSLLFVIPGIIKQASYAMTNYLLEKYPDLSATDAITLSRDMMDGYKVEYFILHYSFAPFMLLAPFTLGGMTFYLVPYYYVTQMEFFDKIHERYLENRAATETME